LIRVVGAWVLAVHFDVGLFGIWLVTTADWGVRLLVLGVVFVRGRWQSIEV
jgi:Na+-driven multidrug efflux pump